MWYLEACARSFGNWIITWIGKAPGYAVLTFTALGCATGLCVGAFLTGGEFVAALGVILGAHFGGGAMVARRDHAGNGKIESGKRS